MRELGLIVCALIAAGACRSAPEPASPAPTTPAAAEAPVAPDVEPRQPGDPQTATPAGSAEPVAIYDASTTAIATKVGSRFVIALPANIATPMRWYVEQGHPDPSAPSAPLLSAPSEAYHDAPPADCAGCTGYPGTRTLAFEALSAGTTRLRLQYRSLTDKTATPERELLIDVRVE